MIKSILVKLKVLLLIMDVVLSPFVFLVVSWLRIVKYLGLKSFGLTKSILFRIGIFPIVDHYYEPRFDFEDYPFTNSQRQLNVLDFDERNQIELFQGFTYQHELTNFPIENTHDHTFYFDNPSFKSGDAELYYSLIRTLKPQRIIEIGSGFSTRIAITASERNYDEGKTSCQINCIEPYEMPWLEKLGVNVIRNRVEFMDLNFFKQLKENDILFIDSSHIIRPGGDVLFEILQILPSLEKGVFIHFHDIFSPFEYPKDWLLKEFRLWNEQYLLESFLAYNHSFKIVASLAYLYRKYPQTVEEAFPMLQKHPNSYPGSFWIQKVL